MSPWAEADEFRVAQAAAQFEGAATAFAFGDDGRTVGESAQCLRDPLPFAGGSRRGGHDVVGPAFDEPDAAQQFQIGVGCGGVACLGCFELADLRFHGLRRAQSEMLEILFACDRFGAGLGLGLRALRFLGWLWCRRLGGLFGQWRWRRLGLEAGTVDAVFAAVSADRYLFVGFQRVPPLVDGDAVELLDFLGRVFRGHDAP